MKNIDTVINEILDSDEAKIETSRARRTQFVNELKARLEGKKGLSRFIELCKMTPGIYKFYRNEGSRV